MSQVYKNPVPTVDAVITNDRNMVVLVLRKNAPHGWALPGGFVDEGESFVHACVREAREETGLEVIPVEQFFTYSDPKRDPRRHTVSTVYCCRAVGDTEPKAADDALRAQYFHENAIPWAELAFDHAQIIHDFFHWQKTNERPWSHR
jgi:8-oxo-dGTP diphosphatase